METNIAQNVGVDICKATLDVHLHPAGIARQFANIAKGIAALIGWLSGHEIARVVFEPTGPYHSDFERRLGDHGMPVAKVNPRQARRFAEAIGCQAKTDAVDAAMLARKGALLEPPSRPIASETLDAMKELHVPRHALVKDRPLQETAITSADRAFLSGTPRSGSRKSTVRSPPSTPS